MSKGRKRANHQREQLRQRHERRQKAAMLPFYEEVFNRRSQDPERASKIAAMDADAEIAPIVTGIAHAESYELSVQSQRTAADLIKEWCVLNGLTYLYEWSEPIAAMTDDEVIAAIVADRDAGLIPKPPVDVAS